LLIEVHPEPDLALCDGAQSLRPERFAELMEEIESIAKIVRKEYAQ